MSSQSGDGSQNPGPESVKSADGNVQDNQRVSGNESSEKPLAAMLEPMREEQVENAVKFLSHPRVRGSPVVYRRSFLEKKGLTKEEIDEAFRRVPDPPPDVTKVDTATTNQASQPKQSTSVQPQAPIQTQQPAASVGGATLLASVQQPRFHWSHALLAVGVLAASGAGTAVLFKKTVLPRLKAWIRNVVAEKSETEKEDKPPGPSLAEEAAEAAKAAASAAAIVAKTSQELIESRNEERKFLESFMSLVDVQVKEMKSMGEAIRKLETTRQYNYSQDQLIEDHAQSTIVNGATTNSWRSTQLNQSGSGPPPAFSKQAKVNGTSNTDIGAARPSSSPASMESLTAPHPKSYTEIMAMIQRGEKPPGIKEINDMPPNPNQPPSKSLLTPRPKPWEVAQQKPSYSLQSQSSAEGFSSELQYNGAPQTNERAYDATEPGWKKTVKITEIESEGEEQKQLSYQTERPVKRGWVPPQPPSVVMPEAAAAIRQPKSSVQKQPSIEEQSVQKQPSIEEQSVPRSEDVEGSESTSGGPIDMNQAEIQEELTNGIEF